MDDSEVGKMRQELSRLRRDKEDLEVIHSISPPHSPIENKNSEFGNA